MRDDQRVRKVSGATDKVFGKLPENMSGDVFVHDYGADKGVPGCGKQFLAEHEIYTEGESDLQRPSEPQY
jgi:hypothetical protein